MPRRSPSISPSRDRRRKDRRRSCSRSPSRDRRRKDRRRSCSRSGSRRRRSRSRSDSPPRRRRTRSRSRERSQPESDDEDRARGDPMAALEAAAAPASAPDPMAALEAAAVKAVPPPGSTHGSSTQSDPATPFDFFEAFQRARPEQVAAPRCKPATSTATSACALEPASAGRPASEEGSMQAGLRGSVADPGCGGVHGSSLPRAEEATANAVEPAHQELDPLARLLVRQSRQVHVRVPRQATAASAASDAQPRAEGRRGQPARFAPQYDTVDRAADAVPQD